eukprot:TRINITY_DN2367_c0_g1_i1.p1 TRINITY_DN2367_c0_g1~~TRINITY_DN2367_c0_g1_i1.p1  ORF type:complete len:492 (+),score=43.44 TRINITY_DN2367_c0_g1_i1:91-1476(+)
MFIPNFLKTGLYQLHQTVGVPEDQLRFLLCVLAAYPIGLLFRSIPGTTTKHLFCVITGIWIGNFLVSYQWIHTLIGSLVVYFALLFFGPKARYFTLVFAMTYIGCLHIYRQWTDYLGWTFDVTMQMMIVIQKLTIIGFNYYDGTDNKKPTEDQKQHALKQLPGVIEFLGWIYMPTNFAMGPMFEFVEYLKVARGEVPKSNILQALKVLLVSLICLGINQVGSLYYPVDLMRQDEFLNQNPITIYFSCLLIAFVARFKYYFGFKVAEGAALMGGLGYTGKDETTKQEKWDGMNNMDILAFEMSQSFRDSSLAWNKKTSLWLRRLVYDRLPAPYNLQVVYLFSAIWHGFYPGYYMFFFPIGILSGVNRTIHNTLRPRAIAMGSTVKQIYDVLGWFTTLALRDYYILSFCLLEFSASMRLYASVYYCGHVVSLFAWVFFSLGILKPVRKIVTITETTKTFIKQE